MEEWPTGRGVFCMMYRGFQDGGSNKDLSMVIRLIELQIAAGVKKMMMRRRIDKEHDPSISNAWTFLP